MRGGTLVVAGLLLLAGVAAGQVDPTTTTSTSTTTTTAACVDAATFDSVVCKTAELVAAVDAATDLGSSQALIKKRAERLESQVEKASAQQGNAGKAKKLLKTAIRDCIGFAQPLKSLKARKSIPRSTREPLVTRVNLIKSSLTQLRGTL